MIYNKLRKHEKIHPAMEFLYDIEIQKLAVELSISYKHLIGVLNGKIKGSVRLEKDLWRVIEEINKERQK